MDRREIARLNDKLGEVLGTRLGDSARRSSRTRRSSTPTREPRARSRRCATSTRRRATWRRSPAVYRRLVPLQEDAARREGGSGSSSPRCCSGPGKKREAIEQAKLAFDIEPHAAEELVRLEEMFRRPAPAQDGVRAAEARAALLAAQGGPAEAVAGVARGRGAVEARRGAPTRAAAALEKVLELDPANRTAYERAARRSTQAAGNWRAVRARLRPVRAAARRPAPRSSRS